MRLSLIRYLARRQATRRGLAGARPVTGAATIAVAAAAMTVTALAACAPARAAEDDALIRLRAMSAASVCRQAADCATVPVGHKACGGPAAYVAVAQADLPAAQALAQRHLRQRLQQRRTHPEPPSTCNLVQDPGAQCVEGRCSAGNGGTPRAD